MEKAILYIVTIVHLPWTLFRVIISCILIVDAWCDEVIHGTIKEVKDKIKQEK